MVRDADETTRRDPAPAPTLPSTTPSSSPGTGPESRESLPPVETEAGGPGTGGYCYLLRRLLDDHDKEHPSPVPVSSPDEVPRGRKLPGPLKAVVGTVEEVEPVADTEATVTTDVGAPRLSGTMSRK